ncbi:MAG: DoxX family membrane protein [Candidatus Aminicenantes bacterium]|nr:DoxX family membrane protein [Candidatus Aminicenantes bacterium]
MTRKRAVLLVFRLFVGGVFIYSGVVKILDPLAFAQQVRNYRTVGQDLAFVVALYLPWLEALAGAFLMAGIFKKASAALISLMLGGFIVLVAATMVRGIDVDCGCFGALSRRADWRLLLEDAVLLAMSLAIFFAARGARSGSAAHKR